MLQAQNSMEPESVYGYMQAQGIGVTQAALYIAWAEEHVKHGNFRKADAIFQEGHKSGAQPIDKLLQYHKCVIQLILFLSDPTCHLWQYTRSLHALLIPRQMILFQPRTSLPDSTNPELGGLLN